MAVGGTHSSPRKSLPANGSDDIAPNEALFLLVASVDALACVAAAAAVGENDGIADADVARGDSPKSSKSAIAGGAWLALVVVVVAFEVEDHDSLDLKDASLDSGGDDGNKLVLVKL